MIIIKGLYDSNNKRLIIDYSCSLLRDHFGIFRNEVEKSKKIGRIPSDLELQQIEDTRCLIIIPFILPGAENLENGDRITGVPKDLIDKITELLDNFRDSAMEKEFTTTEFIPLIGYPIKDLQTDVIEAIKNKRNFCIIDKYSDYKKFSKHEITKLRQHKVMYKTNDYSEVALCIYEGDLKSLRERFIPKLEEVDWE